jgi:hypothetical protein
MIASFLIVSNEDAIKKNFPWYERMHALLGTSPVVSRVAIAHSSSQVDLGVLSRDGELTGNIEVCLHNLLTVSECTK